MLPFILLGAAVLAGGLGVKKGIDAKDDFDKAESLNAEAKEIYDAAVQRLETARKNAQGSVDRLGIVKFQIYEHNLLPFVASFSKIKNIDFQDARLVGELEAVGISNDEMQSIEKAALDMQDVVIGGVAALGAGGLAGLAVYGGVGALASTATTGIAIAELSGVAATNATLAWLGGGALSAGGFGMAGGVAVLGGIVAGPVLAIGGLVLASKAEEAMHNAYTNLSKARLAVEQLDAAKIKTSDIYKHFSEVLDVLQNLQYFFNLLLDGLQKLVANNTDYQTYSVEDRKGVMMAAALAKTMKNILEAPLLSEDGEIIASSMQIFQDAQKQIDSICS
jgi:hypothetical protein